MWVVASTKDLFDPRILSSKVQAVSWDVLAQAPAEYQCPNRVTDVLLGTDLFVADSEHRRKIQGPIKGKQTVGRSKFE